DLPNRGDICAHGLRTRLNCERGLVLVPTPVARATGNGSDAGDAATTAVGTREARWPRVCRPSWTRLGSQTGRKWRWRRWQDWRKRTWRPGIVPEALQCH